MSIYGAGRSAGSREIQSVIPPSAGSLLYKARESGYTALVKVRKEKRMVPKNKKRLLQFLFNVAASTFIGICVYGMLIYWGKPNKIAPALSVGLGLLAIVCIALIYFLGTAIDKLEGELRRNKDKGKT